MKMLGEQTMQVDDSDDDLALDRLVHISLDLVIVERLGIRRRVSCVG
jgi:hypothetical protein